MSVETDNLPGGLLTGSHSLFTARAEKPSETERSQSNTYRRQQRETSLLSRLATLALVITAELCLVLPPCNLTNLTKTYK